MPNASGPRCSSSVAVAGALPRQGQVARSGTRCRKFRTLDQVNALRRGRKDRFNESALLVVGLFDGNEALETDVLHERGDIGEACPLH
jgi:hypothetical protein